jgi:hypothetical protein
LLPPPVVDLTKEAFGNAHLENAIIHKRHVFL